jgi:hypothetical protein
MRPCLPGTTKSTQSRPPTVACHPCLVRVSVSDPVPRLAARGLRVAARGLRLAACGLRLAARGSRLAACGSRLAARGSRLAARGSRLAPRMSEGIGSLSPIRNRRLGDLMSDHPKTDDRDPAEVVTNMITQVLELASTWTAWDGRPGLVDDRVYTPHKAVRRVTDHLIDHLAEIEARLAGVATIPDHWHASAITTEADMAPFTPEDLDEARSRLTRLAQIFEIRLSKLTTADLDRRDGDAWSVRQIAFHLEESLYYATAVGRLH